MSAAIAAALAEAWETGHAVAPLPSGCIAADAALDIAGAVLEALAIAPIGVRLTETGLLGPLLDSRLLPAGATLPGPAIRHGFASPALVAVLAEPLGDAPPAFARLHPALDIASSRWRDGPADPAAAVADLASLGHIVLGRGKKDVPVPDRCALVGAAGRARASPADAALLLARAAAAARQMGGLPAGAVLVAVLDGRGRPAPPGGTFAASWPGLGRVTATISEAG